MSIPCHSIPRMGAFALLTCLLSPPTSAQAVLVITGQELAEAWRPFATWKTRLGKPTRVLTVESLRQRYEHEDVRESIRLAVRDHVDHRGTRWIVLGGDCTPDGGIVPGGHRTVHAQEPSGIPTDIVYLSPTDWDADDDGVFGEWEDDREEITYPTGEVGLGRVPVRTAADVAAFTEKVIAYESRYPTTTFAQNMVYTCTDRPAYAKVRQSWDGFVSKVWQNGEVGRFFAHETPWDEDGRPGSHELTAENLVALLNAKSTGKLHIHGHGHLPVWMLEHSRFTSKHVDRLDNDGAYPLITTVSCNTGEYDSAKDPSIVEAMIRKPGGGSVAIVAPIRTGKPHFHQRSDFRLMVMEGKLDGTTQTMTRYWTGGLGDGATTGESLMRAKAAMRDDARKTPGYHLCICELNLLGDPTLDMRAIAPRHPSVEAPTSVGTGEQSVEIVTDAPGSTVCLSNDDVYVVTRADDAGKVHARIAPKTAGELFLTVSGPGLNATTQTIAIAARD